MRYVFLLCCLLAVAAAPAPQSRTPPFVQSLAPADSLIRPGEDHFVHLWQVTFGGENAEAYWSPMGDALTMQSTREGYPCDQIFLVRAGTPGHPLLKLMSTGKGRTTCSYFLGRNDLLLFSSTHLASDSCPPPPDRSRGYTWAVYPSYDIFVRTTRSDSLRPLTNEPGYDAEATVSPDGKTIVFTSDRAKDLELYLMSADGSNVRRLTSDIGYDGGAFFSPDGKWICYRANHPELPEEVAEYQDLLSHNLVRPTRMEIWVMKSDGSDRGQVTDLRAASFAPFFMPDSKRIIFASNYEDEKGRDFNLYITTFDGGIPKKVTTDPTFDGFPMFSPDGRYLAFSSNRGAAKRGDTNVFIAEWKE